MVRTLNSLLAILSMILVGYTPILFAQSQQQGGQDGGRRGGGPPREAMQVCKGKSVGDKVEFKTPRGRTISAECKLIAVPARGQRPQRSGSDNSNSNDSGQQRPRRPNQDDQSN